MSNPAPSAGADPMVSTAELASELGAPDLRLLDSSWFMDGRDARAGWRAAHIPGAGFFDIDAVADPDSSLPHMLPSPEAFAVAAGALGISRDDRIVIYDQAGLFSAPRGWWTFRAMGATRVRVLDGGLPKWRAEGRRLESGSEAAAPAVFEPRFQGHLVRNFDQVRANLEAQTFQLLDARAAPRFRGETPEPRAGLRSGHAPGAVNTPFAELLQANGTLKDRVALQALFAEKSVNLQGALVATCGSGLTAAIVALALARLGRSDVAIYDGSWSEWGSRGDAPVATGP